MDSPVISPPDCPPSVEQPQREIHVKTGLRSGGINPDDVNLVTNGAAAVALQAALAAGKSSEEALKLAEEAAVAAFRASEAMSGGSEASDTQEDLTEAQDDPIGEADDHHELSEEQLNALRLQHHQHEAYLTACLDIAHGHFEYLDFERKKRAAAAMAHKVVSFEEWSKRLGL
jgi:bifunctional ADP-heptose synthase (sugar kinase/adenylyltransferase)